jgi:hypothetical protein
MAIKALMPSSQATNDMNLVGAKLARDSGSVANTVVGWLTAIASKLCSHRVAAYLFPQVCCLTGRH